MTNVGTACFHCGAVNQGTNFCESCGAPAQRPVFVTAAAVPPGALVFHVLTLLTLLALVAIPDLLQISLVQSGAVNYSGLIATVVVLDVLIALFAFIAAFLGRVGPGMKLLGALFAVVYGILSIVFFFHLYLGLNTVQGYTLYCLPFLALFFSWAVSRPLRGPGYLALIGVVGLPFIRTQIGQATANSAAGLGGYLAVDALLGVLAVVIVVGLGAGLGRAIRPTGL